ncbi:retron Ec67 family RNA-directed DNA polymerase/endonuclease [Enterobacter hormaechei]|uniref:retron Ec67 family RNA-directed DNA polymerase/endonuclease n=1 Tax=Enterobacteriaceae TaxID=543 RepID=UPI0007356679|nr:MULTISPECIES: retron Ec67 family RNA-directed DNA polymerase/endonuclease [Enterobacteriaceae]EKK5497478.1 retron Ec67 family RNA-directed DNA polymerase/endonuclease [Enterobacter hormaechei]KTG92623.1 reverse transcriptase [Enterobacter hormaechei subsp. steigerwaltii]KVJ92585.1 reverse transcriptase [Enterobacter hormaechei subsp. steigerwaltii]KVJ93512.1 reverse transcriptase [Enterobacter hormaechei subsp. steigerwaltii]QEQ47440.1 RNA-directed DNA polymerase [Enterobacter hormaechei]
MTTRLDKLKSCNSKPDLARLLGIDPVFMTRVIYIRNTDNLYSQFTIKKKNGSDRHISAPDPELKEIQSKLSDLLQDCLNNIRENSKEDNNFSHGFERNRSIITNAEKHKSKKWVLNIDLSNFFDEFNFGRVRGYFLKNKNFSLNTELSTLIAKIACHQDKLPQGSPCSPVITNLILLSLDRRLSNLCNRAGCTYTRYADDITISTNKKEFPRNIIKSHNENSIDLNKKFLNEIISSGFQINLNKLRLFDRKCRQEVTGLTVNRFVNVDNKYAKKVRAMAHSLFTKGGYTLTDEKTREQRAGDINELGGMLSFIDYVDKHNNRLPHATKTSLNKRENVYSDFLYYSAFWANPKPTILTEGKTDITYLRVALDSLSANYPNLIGNKKIGNKIVRDYGVKFFKNTTKSKYFLNLDGGASHLKDFIVGYEKKTNAFKAIAEQKPVIIVLDNDSGSGGSNGIFQTLIGKAFPNITLSKDELRNQKWTWVTKNLYLIFTPLNGLNDSSMEDLFHSSVLQTKLGGKVFNRTNAKCKDNEYGKEFFATGVVLKQRKAINFSNFNYIFESITEIIDHNASRKP